jgi:predicted small metal-binding protein
MTRSHIDCREIPSEEDCTVAISADREEELLEAAVHHAVAVHGHQDTPGLRGQLREVLRRGPLP